MYQVKLDKEQMETVIRALDLYMRLGIHQVSEIRALVLDEMIVNKADLPKNWHQEVDQALMSLKSNLWGESLNSGPSSGPSIHNPTVRKTFKLAADIHHALRRFLDFEREPQGGTGVDFGNLYSISGHPSTAQVEKIK